ncbi:unnamed protein product [Cuscuta campestris]|uniref:Reverse transcriptase domain-containing protein n=1 Tax=Cuscuta campestris TaxID=132261 RepID=A0A484L7A6_9ASTE|nr:unnamed protein product [Cuscuta campestris]
MTARKRGRPRRKKPTAAVGGAKLNPSNGVSESPGGGESSTGAEEMNGLKVARLSREDVEEDAGWNSTLVCCVLRANPPLKVMDGFLRRIWKDYKIADVVVLREGQFVVHFEKEEDRDEIARRKYYFLDNKPMLVQRWKPGCKLNLDELTDIPIWVRIGGTPVGMEEIRDFKECLEVCGLEEMPMEGSYYTWSNRQSQGHRIYSRIDRALCNTEWMLSMGTKLVVKEEVEGDKKVAETLVSYFQDLIGTQSDIEDVDMEAMKEGTSLNIDQQLTLIAEVKRIQINGESYGFFKGKKGLRQGDPISPMLFVLVMECLNRLLQQMAKDKRFKFHPMCRSLKLVNLSFTDDLIIVCKAEEEFQNCIMEVMRKFQKSTGLGINYTKSQIIFGGVDKKDQEHFLKLTNLPLGELPIRYLGSPISAGDNSASENHPHPPLLQVPFLNLEIPTDTEENTAHSREKQSERRRRIIDRLLQSYKRDKLQHGCIKAVAGEFNISRKIVGKIWSSASGQMQDGLPVCVQCKRKGNSGRKEVPVDIPKMLAVPFHRHKNICALGYAIEV